MCKDCRQFVRDYANLEGVKTVRDLVVPLTINGAGILDIERVLFLSINTILKTLREAAKRADEPVYPRRVRDLEMDEFWSFVGAKRIQCETWYGYDRQRPKLLPTRRRQIGKEGTSRIERHNLNFRTRLKRLQRHTICY